ncbi:MAG: DUF1175 family protein [Pyrinomonadaceae bacterium]
MKRSIACISFPLLLLGAIAVAALVSISACRDAASLETHAARTPSISTSAKWNDSQRDGIPDCIRLRSFNDRENFRRWFTGIAELQFYHQSDAWKAEQRDCAGLVRFALREALREHNRAWFRKMGAIYEPLAPDVRAYTLERNPLGEKLFRTKSGAFTESDLTSGAFNEFADARTLKDFNSRFVSRNRSEAEPGDLLFFYQPWAQKFPYHVMIFLGKAYQADDVAGAATVGDAAASDWVIYHTGASPADSGTIKKVRLGVLDQHPDKRWRPVSNNHNFLGFYRLKILQ